MSTVSAKGVIVGVAVIHGLSSTKRTIQAVGTAFGHAQVIAMPLARRIVQVSSAHRISGDVITTVLCDDGTLWTRSEARGSAWDKVDTTTITGWHP